ncbi:DUF6290 family protein [uncultured Tenacibaculum sp.]
MRKDEIITIRISHDDKELIRAVAEKNRLTIGSYIRTEIMKKL